MNLEIRAFWFIVFPVFFIVVMFLIILEVCQLLILVALLCRVYVHIGLLFRIFFSVVGVKQSFLILAVFMFPVVNESASSRTIC